jgi:hypothetical protein
LVEDWDLTFAIVDQFILDGAGLTYCEGDPSGFFDDPRSKPYLSW